MKNVHQILAGLSAVSFCCAVMAKTGDVGWFAVAIFGCNFLITVCSKDNYGRVT